MAAEDTTVLKVDSRHSPRGEQGQKYLASGKNISMRLWEAVAAGTEEEPVARNYECVGYVISGRAELRLEHGQMIVLEPGNSWVVPKSATHSYKVLEEFTAIEATYPPYQVHGRDQDPG